MSSVSDSDSEKECPLCMEAFDFDDLSFFPCKCGYQICRFCWNRLREDDQPLCPACRQVYSEEPVNFVALSTADVVKLRKEKAAQKQLERNKAHEGRKHLVSYRVLQKNLVYVVGLSQRVANADVLRRPEYFGAYGRVLKVVIGSPVGPVAQHGGLQPSQQSCNAFTAYVTFSRVEDALRAIQGVNNSVLDGRTVKASLGTTKYCSSFLRSQPCHKPECMYLHEKADDELSFTKDDMSAGKHTDYERRLIESVCRAANNAQQSAYRQRPKTTLDTGGETRVNGHHTTTKRNGRGETVSPTPTGSFGDGNGAATRQRSAEPGGSSASFNNRPRPHRARTDSSTKTPSPILVANSLVDDKISSTQHADDISASVVTNDSGGNSPPTDPSWKSLLGLDSRLSAPPPPPVSVTQPQKAQTASRAVASPSPPPSDDELGFDPFSESTRGLEALIREELRLGSPAPAAHAAHALHAQHHQPQQPHHHHHHHHHQLYAPQHYQTPLAPLPSLQQQQHHHQPHHLDWGQHNNGGSLSATRPGPPGIGPPSTGGSVGVAPRQQSLTGLFAAEPPLGFGAARAQQHSASAYGSTPPQPTVSNHAAADFGQYSSSDLDSWTAFQRHQQQHQAATAARSNVQQPASISEWQQGLKALLPNVNIRFSNELSWQNGGGGGNGTSWEQQQQVYAQQQFLSSSQQLPQPSGTGSGSATAFSLSPPPGFH